MSSRSCSKISSLIASLFEYEYEHRQAPEYEYDLMPEHHCITSKRAEDTKLSKGWNRED
jgi:hypothetical protein